MSTTIFYFSGTGNSFYVAKDIAQALDAGFIPIASAARGEVVRTEADVIGIVFPVYYGDLPYIVREFAGKLEDIKGKYIFSVCTFGGSAGESHKTLRSSIESRGGELSATYGVHMPQNAFYKFWEKHQSLYRNWRKMLKTVVKNTNERRKGAFFTNPLFDLIFLGIQAYVRSKYKQSFAKLSGSSPDLSVEELVHLNDVSFSVTDDCTGCGLCAKLCPVNNIEMVDERPVWQHRCENCLACYNFCPSKAIRTGVASEGYFYHQPDIKAADILRQKGG
ncbi:MAG: EFR1 family ferrodoxin [Dehalococcoidales bacterium]|nr:EFR1 family ferrodoxin [Dehalococcoidales bacterium]